MDIIEKISSFLYKIRYNFSENDILNRTFIYLEKEYDDSLLSIEIEKSVIKIQFNLQENCFFKNIENIFYDYFNSKYKIKYYYNNERILYSKFIWQSKELKRYNFKTKYGFLHCRKINRIETIQGINWNLQEDDISGI